MGLLDGRVAIVTGSGRGIGREFALCFAREGASVVVNDVGVSLDGRGTQEDPAAQVCDEIETLGSKAVPNYDSVTDFDAARDIVRTAVAAAGATRMTAALYERSGKEPPPEENPALNAPLVAFLASEGAAHVNGQILGRTEYAYTLFQHPKQIAWMWKDGGWSADEVAEKFDATLGR